MATVKRSGAAALPVRTGEKPWTEAELDKVRAELQAEVEELRTNIDRAELEIAERLRPTREPRRSSVNTTFPSPRMPGTCLTSA
jgi:hypothetical protein